MCFSYWRVFIRDTKSSKFCDIMQFILPAVALFLKFQDMREETVFFWYGWVSLYFKLIFKIKYQNKELGYKNQEQML